MAYDRPSWREIDKMRDGSGARKRRDRPNKDLGRHSTRYDKYKEDLNRLFDQGMAGELLKKTGKDQEPEPGDTPRTKGLSKAKKAPPTRKGNGRIPKSTKASTSRLRLIRTVINAEDSKMLSEAIDELVASFGLPDDWEVLARVLEHDNEDLVIGAVEKMSGLLAKTAKIPRRFTTKERLRSIGQTASSGHLRELATELEARL